jgi:hypothetical protein
MWTAHKVRWSTGGPNDFELGLKLWPTPARQTTLAEAEARIRDFDAALFAGMSSG